MNLENHDGQVYGHTGLLITEENFGTCKPLCEMLHDIHIKRACA